MRSAFPHKQNPKCADPQAILVRASCEFSYIACQVILQRIQSPTDVPAVFFGQRSQLA